MSEKAKKYDGYATKTFLVAAGALVLSSCSQSTGTLAKPDVPAITTAAAPESVATAASTFKFIHEKAKILLNSAVTDDKIYKRAFGSNELDPEQNAVTIRRYAESTLPAGGTGSEALYEVTAVGEKGSEVTKDSIDNANVINLRVSQDNGNYTTMLYNGVFTERDDRTVSIDVTYLEPGKGINKKYELSTEDKNVQGTNFKHITEADYPDMIKQAEAVYDDFLHGAAVKYPLAIG